MPYPGVKTYEEARTIVERVGILPFLTGFIPDHPSLDTLTEAVAWHTDSETDPWRWRERFATEGMAAYGRFIGSKTALVSREIFPLVRGTLAGSETVEGRYAGGVLARPVVQMYQIIEEHGGIEARALKRLMGMQDKSKKGDFDRALIELQNRAEIVMAGTLENSSGSGGKSGWNSTYYMLAEAWMKQHGIEPLPLSSGEAKEQLLAWIGPRWEERAVRYLEKKFTL